MRTRNDLIPFVLILFLIVLACGPFSTSTATATFPPLEEEPPTRTSIPTFTLSAQSASETVVPPTAQPQPAAPAHYHAGDPIQLDEIHMLSQTEGWGISGPYVLTTADGGQTWREATPPDPSLAGDQAKVYGVFLDAQSAWVIFAAGDWIPPESSVWHTTDGGRTWTLGRPLLHEAYGDIVWAEFASLDPDHVWLMMRGVYAGAGTHYAAQFFRTVDGGLTWASLDGDVGVDYTGMAFADADTGWLIWQTTGAYYNWPPEYATTSDGGLRWESRQLPPPPDAPEIFDQYMYCEPFQLNLLSSRSVRLLVGCFDAHYPPQEFTSYLYVSEDGGITWTTTHLPDAVLASDATLIFFGAREALLLGREIYLTEDGGRTWSHVKTVNWDGQFSFVDPQHGWAVARAGDEVALVSTANGGATWAQTMPVIGE